MRNILRTVIQLPTTYSGHLTIMMNDRDIYTVARNVFTVLLVGTTDTNDTLENTLDTLVHLWYSRCLTDVHIHLLRNRLRPIISDVCNKVRNKKPGNFQSKKIPLRGGSIDMTFLPGQWGQLLEILDTTHDYAKAKKSYKDVSLGRPDHLDRHLFTIRHDLHRRKSIMRFRESGLTLPFGTDPSDFTCPNP